MTWAVLAVSAAFFLSLLACGRLARPDSRWFVADRPNERSMHVRVTPRNGGFGVLLGLGVGLAVLLAGGFGGPLWWLLAGVPPLALMSAVDDRRSLPARLRLLVHLLVGGGVAAGILALSGASWLWWPVWTLGLAWCINLYNFMDGLDGLAGGQAVTGFAGLGFAAAVAGAESLAVLPLVVAAAAGGFLVRNWPPAAIFLGDVGSTSLGLLAGTLGLAGVALGHWPFWVPLVLFAPFWLDATGTLLARWRRGARLSEAHREHLYQRLALAGWPHRRVLLVFIAAMLWGGAMVAWGSAGGVGGVAAPLVWAAGLAIGIVRLRSALKGRSSSTGAG